MAKINEITINGFKAFPSMYKLELGGKHLLMYGENGSGKSSIYYALHCLFNSYRKPDMGKKYFDIDNPQNLINKNFISKDAGDRPYVAVNWYDGSRNPFISTISDNGCQNFDKLAELDTYFINHQLLFSFFNFTNSKDINLFPVFQREILPYIFITQVGTYMSLMYDQILSYSSKLSNRSSSKAINESIKIFNSCLEQIIGDINLKASDIYNTYFKENGEPPLLIVLSYPEINPHPDVILNGFRLKWDYPLIVNAVGELVKAPNKSIIEPIISIDIKEGGESIDKPHVYFNEAKLTAIALSIRFALLNLDSPAEGSFLALDDMLISLDMSNRAKVVDFLLKISDKYKIYLFTHDKAFYYYIAHLISQKGKSTGWIFKHISYNHTEKQPMVLDDSCDYLSKAKYFYGLGDYETSAIYFRKALEQSVGERLPFELKTRADGGFLELQTLWDKLVTFYAHQGNPINKDMQNIFKTSKLLILNPAAHFQRLANPIYKAELDEVSKLVDYVYMLPKIEKRLILEQGKTLVFQHPKENYTCSFVLDNDLVIIEGEHIVAKIPKCKNIKWEYNGVEYWNFELKKRDLENPLIVATPKLTNFIDNMINKVPLNITQKMFVENCKINGISLLEFMGNIDLLRISVKI